MKRAKLLTTCIAICFAILSAGLANAANPKGGEEKKKTDSKAPSVSGTITLIDAQAGTLTVKGKKGEINLTTDEKTIVKEGKEKKSLSDLKTGDKVSASYIAKDGKNIAKLIAVKPAKSAAEKAEKPKKETKKEPKTHK